MIAAVVTGSFVMAAVGAFYLLTRSHDAYIPYIATTAGWITAEVGRQPWLIYGLMRTAQGPSPRVSAGNGLFTLLGFMGMYTLLAILFLFLIYREIEYGPEPAPGAGAS
jgi:cytochrome bd ubiquinol oxidase subunit I